MKVLSLTLSLQQSIIKQQQNNQRLRLRLLSLSLVFTLTFFSSFFLYNALLLWLCLLLLQLSLSLSTLYLIIVSISIQLFRPKESYSLLLHHQRKSTRESASVCKIPFSFKVLNFLPTFAERTRQLLWARGLCFLTHSVFLV